MIIRSIIPSPTLDILGMSQSFGNVDSWCDTNIGVDKWDRSTLEYSMEDKSITSTYKFFDQKDLLHFMLVWK